MNFDHKEPLIKSIMSFPRKRESRLGLQHHRGLDSRPRSGRGQAFRGNDNVLFRCKRILNQRFHKTHFIRTFAFHLWASLWPICLIATGCSVILYSKDRTPKVTKINLFVYYRYPGSNQYNGAEKFYKKETLPSRFAQTVIDFDDEQKRLIASKADALHFFQMPDSFYHVGEINRPKSQWFRIANDSVDKTVTWDGSI